MIKYKEKLLEALQLDKEGDWDAAHAIVQRIDTRESNWIHAYLHREEGDHANARYWYNRVRKPFPDVSLEVEWKTLHAYVSSS